VYSETTTPRAVAAVSAAFAHASVSQVVPLMSYPMVTVITRLGRVADVSELGGGGGGRARPHTGRSRSVLTLTSHVLSHAVLHCTYLNVKPPELSKNVALVDIPGPQKPVCQCGVTVWRQREGEHRNRDAKHQRELEAKFELEGPEVTPKGANPPPPPPRLLTSPAHKPHRSSLDRQVHRRQGWPCSTS
jgi:hypothetical protein